MPNVKTHVLIDVHFLSEDEHEDRRTHASSRLNLKRSCEKKGLLELIIHLVGGGVRWQTANLLSDRNYTSVVCQCVFPCARLCMYVCVSECVYVYVCVCAYVCVCVCVCVCEREKEIQLIKWFRQAGDASLWAAAPTQVSSFMQRRSKQLPNTPTNPIQSCLMMPHSA